MMRKVIIDTDYCTDPGDFGGVACALTAHKLGLIDVIGFVVNTSFTTTPYAIDAQRKWWGLPQLPVGKWNGSSIDGTPGASADWVGRVAAFGYDLTSGQILDSTVAYRTLLAGVSGKVDISAMGYLNTLSALLDSPADGISGMTGQELVAAKVRKVFCMAGQYPSGPAEWNMRGGGTARADLCTASNNVATNCPVPVIWFGYELASTGDTDTFVGGTFGRNTSTDMVAAAYQSYTTGRPCWDELENWAAIWDCADFTLIRGSQTVNTTTGVNTWTSSPSGKDAYAERAVQTLWMQDRMNRFISATVTDSPILTSWGGAPGITRIDGGRQ